MSEWRQDPLSGRWVIIASGRGRRPNEFAGITHVQADPDACPFCPGHESRTTPEILAVGRPDGAPADSPGWRMRVFPNLYPALTEAPPPVDADSPWPLRPGAGRHEVVVITPDHGGGLHTLAAGELAELLVVLRDRARKLVAVDGVRHVLVFFNQGADAGATLVHPHGQILAAPLVPHLIREKTMRFDDHHARAGECLLCALTAREEEAGERLVAAGPEAVAIAPWASRFPYEMMVVPRAHAPGLESAADHSLRGVAEILAAALGALARIVPAPALNLVLHGAAVGPDAAESRKAFHWHLEILPRLARLAGFEAGTGFAINSVAPEAAARRLRGEES